VISHLAISTVIKGMLEESIELTISVAEATWQWELTKVFFEVIRKHGANGFTSDEVYQEIRNSKVELPPTYTARHIGAFFKSLKAAGHIVKTGAYKLSNRNGSSPLPIYKGVANDVVSSGN
jgi:hypothetical protein